MTDKIEIEWSECPIGRNVEVHLAAFTSRFEDVANRVDDIHEMLSGNGRPGLKAEVKVNSVKLKILFSMLGALGLTILGAALAHWL